jgi:hypothetical protein
MGIIEDARRYQYLRDHVGSVWAETIGSGEECDAAVDAAIVAEDAPTWHRAEPSAEWLPKMINLLTREMNLDHRVRVTLEWASESDEDGGWLTVRPVYPLTVILEIVE